MKHERNNVKHHLEHKHFLNWAEYQEISREQGEATRVKKVSNVKTSKDNPGLPSVKVESDQLQDKGQNMETLIGFFVDNAAVVKEEVMDFETLNEQ